jgi:hypothetical protein
MSTSNTDFTLEAFFSTVCAQITPMGTKNPPEEPRWAGMPADEAFHLIAETASSRSDIAQLMECWREANTTQTASMA